LRERVREMRGKKMCFVGFEFSAHCPQQSKDGSVSVDYSGGCKRRRKMCVERERER
jgi:hypothetical protein